MTKNLLIFLSVLLFISAKGQNRNSVWVFGDSAGIDFSSGSPVVFASSMDGRGNCCSIADSVGNLQFYCNTDYVSTTHVWNKLHNPMANSNSMVGDGFYQGQIILPKPGDSSLYYIFNEYAADGLFYHVVDLSMNGGLGQVIQKNVPVSRLKVADCVTAIRHGNGRDWWLITRHSSQGAITYYNRFITYLVTPSGIADSSYQDFNDGIDGFFEKIIFKSPDSSKFMLINNGGLMKEYNINRCTGIIDTVRTIFEEQTSNFNRFFFMGAYSPNGNLFYVSRNTLGIIGDKNFLLQYDLTASNIPASCDTLDSLYTWPPVDNGALLLGQDGKIYYSQKYTSSVAQDDPYPDSMRYFINENLSVINNPDVVGAGCNYTAFNFNLGSKRAYYGLPNNPNYELGRLVGSPCDTLYVDVKEIKNEAELIVFYHPAGQQLFVNAQKIKGKNGLLQIVDVSGRVVFSSAKKTLPPDFTMDVDLQGLSSGMYLVRLQTEKEVMSKKFVKL